MKFTYPTSQNSWVEKEPNWSVEDCPKNGGHCWVEYQDPSSIGYGSGRSWSPPRERTCTHCGKRQELKIIPEAQLWEDK